MLWLNQIYYGKLCGRTAKDCLSFDRRQTLLLGLPIQAMALRNHRGQRWPSCACMPSMLQVARHRWLSSQPGCHAAPMIQEERCCGSKPLHLLEGPEPESRVEYIELSPSYLPASQISTCAAMLQIDINSAQAAVMPVLQRCCHDRLRRASLVFTNSQC